MRWWQRKQREQDLDRELRVHLDLETAEQQQSGLSREDEKTMAELWESARRLESRIEGLERVLDAQAPGWRGKP